MRAVVVKPKDRAEWLERRRGGIGSSEVASVLGLNPYQTPYQLWRVKKGLDTPAQENFAMRAGHYLEDAVSRLWADETGREVIKSSAGDWMFVDADRGFLMASPDRTYWITGAPKKSENKGILECKTTQMAIDPDDLPKHWFCQVQYLLGVSGLAQGSLAWLHAGRDFGYRDVAFVPDFFGWMTEEVERFWTDCITGGREPHLRTVADVATKYHRHTEGKIIEATDDIAEAYIRLKQVRAEIEKLEAAKEELEAKIKLGFGDAEAISYGGQMLATWKTPQEKARFDSKAFCAENPDLAAKYTRPAAATRRFVLK